MISTIFIAEKFQIGAGLSGYVAELGSCFLCADLGIVPELEPRPDHASYLASWLKVLADDKRAIFSAAAHAQRAVAFLHGLQPDASSASEEREAARYSTHQYQQGKVTDLPLFACAPSRSELACNPPRTRSAPPRQLRRFIGNLHGRRLGRR